MEAKQVEALLTEEVETTEALPKLNPYKQLGCI